MDLAGVGVWSSQLRYGDAGEAAEAAAELEELGFTALWIPDVGGPVLDSVGQLLSSTKQVVIATGILNLWMHEPADVAEAYASLTAKHGERFLLGIGVSHAPLIDSKEPGLYRKPLAATRAYLDAMDATETRYRRQPGARGSGPENARTVGEPVARGPPVSGDARPHPLRPRAPRRRPAAASRADRAAHRGRVKARKLGTDWLRSYLALPTMPTTCCAPASQEDVTSVSDRLFDAIIAWGDEETVLRRVNEHLAAGADHVCVQVLTADPREFPREQWRRLAAALQ